MKKVFIVLFISTIMSACGGNSKSGTSDSTAAANETAKATESDADTNANKTGTEDSGTAAAPGAKLMAGSDCTTCHKPDVKLVGPALQDIAAKYANATDAVIDTLTNKVIKGGKGNWGDIPMAAHPTLKPADVKQMVQYILSLKK